jgi:hypothetical protein
MLRFRAPWVGGSFPEPLFRLAEPSLLQEHDAEIYYRDVVTRPE